MAQAQHNSGSADDWPGEIDIRNSKRPSPTWFRVICWLILFLIVLGLVLGPFICEFVMLLLLFASSAMLMRRLTESHLTVAPHRSFAHCEIGVTERIVPDDLSQGTIMLQHENSECIFDRDDAGPHFA